MRRSRIDSFSHGSQNVNKTCAYGGAGSDTRVDGLVNAIGMETKCRKEVNIHETLAVSRYSEQVEGMVILG